ncbi:MAG: adenosine-specific kinase [Candidatus Aenigmatarchaeota archaeon]
MEIKVIKIEPEEGVNMILGQSHFIKTVEDLYEVMVSTVPNVKFGLAFCESSGDRLVRVEGNDDHLKKKAGNKMMEIGAGHSFIIFMKDAYPINVLSRIKDVQEVCRIFCATANPVEVIVAETEQGRGILGVIDGEKPKGIEDEKGIKWRKEILRKFGYKK